MTVKVFNVKELNAFKDPRLRGKKAKQQQKASVKTEDIDWEHHFEVMRTFFGCKEEHIPDRKVGERPIELETIENATRDNAVNEIRRDALEILKKGEGAFASDICRITARRILLDKYRRGELQSVDKEHVRFLTGYLVQKACKGLVMKWDPILCVRVWERWVIKRRY